MLWSRALIPTVKEAPADATNASHILLTRGGYIRRVGAGMYDFLPLGVKVLRKVEAIVRREMNKAGAQEVLMPALLPGEFFKETGRWDLYGETLFRLKDRKGSDFHLGPTHEEIVTDIARREIRSYRDMPKNLYQVQTKFRDEPRPRGGLLRCREFIMKDAYSFDVDEESAKKSYEEMRVAYNQIFNTMGLKFRMVAADAGAIGGDTSAEFQVLVDSGEDAIVVCDTCDYAANVEVASAAARPRVSEAAQTVRLADMQKVHTPGHGTIADISKFLKVDPSQMLKSLVYVAGKEVVLVVVRGDHEVNEIRVARALGVDEVFLASDAEVERATGAKVGFAGPVGFKGKVLIDRAASLVPNGATGANETDYHLTGVNIVRDFQGEVVDVRLATNGDPCPSCAKDGKNGKLTLYKGIEGGHIFILGTKYSAAMNANYLDPQQEKKPIIMGCYGIGVSRLVATIVEQHHDEQGIAWPWRVAPYHVVIVSLGKDAPVLEAATKLYADLTARGIDVLWDDRDERPGVKFKDADLIGVPLRVTIGGKGLAGGNVEVKPRSEPDPKKAELVPVADAAKIIADRVLAEIS
ncbi:MAG TPA: proline--tRNA ligase [Polyangiaceae bacterium]